MKQPKHFQFQTMVQSVRCLTLAACGAASMLASAAQVQAANCYQNFSSCLRNAEMCEDENKCWNRCFTKLDICDQDPNKKWPTKVPPPKPKRQKDIIDHSDEHDGTTGDDPSDGFTGAG